MTFDESAAFEPKASCCFTSEPNGCVASSRPIIGPSPIVIQIAAIAYIATQPHSTIVRFAWKISTSASERMALPPPTVAAFFTLMLSTRSRI